MGQELISPLRRTHPRHVASKRQRKVASWRSRKLAAFITATNGAPPEHPSIAGAVPSNGVCKRCDCRVGRNRRDAYSTKCPQRGTPTSGTFWLASWRWVG